MNYQELISKINKDSFAKGYNVSFLQDKCVGHRNGAERFEKIVAGDKKLFEEIEQNMAEIQEPVNGDFVEYEDGKFARISTCRHSRTFQISNNIGIFVSKDGSSMASGCTWDKDFDYIDSKRLSFDNLTPTNKTLKGRCWTFSGNDAGAGRGIYSEINFKVWLLG